MYSSVMAFVRLPVLQTRGAQLLMLMRLLMAFAFHVWAPVWQVSVNRRFAFGPKDHGMFMGVIGLTCTPLAPAARPSRLLPGRPHTRRSLEGQTRYRKG